MAGDSTIAEGVRVAARAHQSMIWMRQRAQNTLRSLLRECYPAALAAFADDLAGRDALAVLNVAPGPGAGRRLTPARVAALLRRAGRQRNLDARAEQIVAALRSEQLPARVELEAVNAASVAALVAVITTMVAGTGALEEQERLGFGPHPGAEIYLSQPGLGTILAARVLAEMGDDPDRYADARARKTYAGMAPVARASGTNGWCWPGNPATNDSPTRSTSSLRSPQQLVWPPRRSTTANALVASPTTSDYCTRRCPQRTIRRKIKDLEAAGYAITRTA